MKSKQPNWYLYILALIVLIIQCIYLLSINSSIYAYFIIIGTTICYGALLVFSVLLNSSDKEKKS
jgi:hypothetical protein